MSALLCVQIVFVVFVLVTISAIDNQKVKKVLCCDRQSTNLACKHLNVDIEACAKDDVEVNGISFNKSTPLWCLSESSTAGLVLFPCNESTTDKTTTNRRNLINLTIRRKCCPAGYIYSRNEMRCIEQQQFHLIKTYDVAVFEDQPPVALITNNLICRQQQILVEYSDVSRQQLDFVYDGTLLFNNKRYTQDDYCTEEIFDLELNEANPKRFLLRICEQATICARIPCMRRCCGIGQKYAKINGTTHCMPTELDNTFENFAGLHIKAMKEIPKSKSAFYFTKLAH